MPKAPPLVKLPVCDADLMNLRCSGLTDETIRANQLRTENRSLVFPYQNLAGRVDGFYRTRPHKPRVIDGKPVKYEQAKGSPLHAYFPTASLTKIRDGRSPIHITEGEKKALALSQLGLAAIGLGGVWCACKKGTEELIDDLAVIDWKDRDVYLDLDYDAKSKTRLDVNDAKYKLARALKKQGAVVLSVDLPPGANGSKQGVDDFLVAHGKDAFLSLVEEATEIGDDGLQTWRLSEVEPEEVEWVWQNRILRGKLNVVHGDPGQGKTWLVLDILAHITTGKPFCDGTPCKRGEVLFVTAEDGIADTIRPRLDLLKAAVSRIHTLDMVRISGREVSLDLDQHLTQIDHWLQQHPQVTAVAFDPLAAFLGKIDSHRNNEVRSVLGRLAAMAEKRNVAIIAIDHLAKAQGKALHRGIGSIAFTAAPRAVWQVLADPDDPDRRFFLPVKMNLAKVDGLAFRITDSGLEWETGKITISPDEVTATMDGDTPRSEAKTWLRDVLSNGPYPAADVERRADQDGICMRTLKYAKKEMGVESRREKNMWCWCPPATKKAPTEKVTTKSVKPLNKNPLHSYPLTPYQQRLREEGKKVRV
jgi:hypothetical protein